VHVTVLAKAPVPGRVKTRLVPPYSPAEAAALAEAALADTLAAAVGSGADEVVVALDGRPGPWLPPGCRVVAQRGGGLDERLAAAWADAGGPGVQVGMDTPQLTSADLDAALAALADHDAALGLAEDGGWWAIALRRPDERVFLGIPTSRGDTGVRQRRRLAALGLRVADLPVRRDVDHAADVAAVAALAPAGRFAAVARGWRRAG
jgi:rSAM/selenodomain-associated transferase 1